MLHGLDLFSGIGGISIALSEWVRPIAYCENDRYAQSVLLSQMLRGSLSRAPIWDDVRTLNGDVLGTKPDIIYGGFPCQDISAAGLGRGLDGARSRLYWEIHRLVRECKPSFVFLENVPAIRTRGLGDVVRSLAALGYDCRWTIVSAREIGAPHLRKRWFLLAKRADAATVLGPEIERCEPHGDFECLEVVADSEGLGREGRRCRSGLAPDSKWGGLHLSRCSKTLADANGSGFKFDCEVQARSEREPWRNALAGGSWWNTEPDVGRVADGIPARVDRLRGLGNAVVPLQAKIAFQRLAGISNKVK